MSMTQNNQETGWVQLITNELDSQGIKSRRDLPLKEVSTFAIGGPCALSVFPQNANELIFAADLAAKYSIKFEVVGKASNILFSDDGYRGMIIFTSQMKQISRKFTTDVFVEAGVNLTTASLRASVWGLSGLEFACGIPGSCAGAVYMNAGAYGGEISDILEYSEYYSITQNKILTVSKDEHKFSYRHSIYQDNKDMIIIGAGLRLSEGSIDEIRSKMNEYTQKRRTSQPHEYPNAGSIFKRPPEGYAAKMIDDCGLKGLTIGGAQISEKHAGFIVNRNNATARDVLTLINVIKERVLAQFGIELECEIRII